MRNQEIGSVDYGDPQREYLKVGDVISVESEGDHVVTRIESASELGAQFGLKITRDVPVYYLDGPGIKRKAAYHTKSDFILVYTNTFDFEIKHELVHAIEVPQEKTPELQELYDKVKDLITESSFESGYTTFNFRKNISEFIADGYSKDVFIDALKKEGLYEEFLEKTAYLFN